MNPSMNPSSAKSAQRDGKHAALRSTMVCLPVVLAAILTGCGRSAAASSDPPAGRQRVEEASDSSLVTVVHPERFELVDVSTRRVADRLSGTCTVSADVSRTVPVNALVGGRVVDLRVRLGDVVHKGEPLVTIQSPDLASAVADHLKADADLSLHGRISSGRVCSTSTARSPARTSRPPRTRSRRLKSTRGRPMRELKCSAAIAASGVAHRRQGPDRRDHHRAKRRARSGREVAGQCTELAHGR